MKRFKTLFLSLIILCTLTGCATDLLNKQDNNTDYIGNDLTQVGRYSSIENTPTISQKNPLLAISQFKFNARIKTVGQALTQVLQDTGYSLVYENQLPVSVRDVLLKALPITQRELGPISVSDALRVLIGDQVFNLVVDPVHRLITFKLKNKKLQPGILDGIEIANLKEGGLYEQH